MSGAGRETALPLGLLLLFAIVIDAGPRLARPASPPDDCDRLAASGPSNVDAIERCLTIHPDDIELMIDAASAYARSGQRDRAAALYTRALSVDPKDTEVRAALDALRAPPASSR